MARQLMHTSTPLQRTLLLVDDEPLILSVLRRQFEGFGYSVHTARNGELALTALAAAPIDAVISDMRMPGMNGLELLRRLSLHWPAVIRVLLTGFSDLDLTVAAIRQGHVERYLTKPWDPDALASALDRAFVARHGFGKQAPDDATSGRRRCG